MKMFEKAIKNFIPYMIAILVGIVFCYLLISLGGSLSSVFIEISVFLLILFICYVIFLFVDEKESNYIMTLEEGRDIANNNLEKDQILSLLCSYGSQRVGQDQVVWNMFGAFWATNALLLVSVFSADEVWDKKYVWLVVSLIGFMVSVAWFLVQDRMLNRIARYEISIKFIEKTLVFPKPLRTYSNSPLRSLIDVRARNVMRLVVFLIGVTWLIKALLVYVPSIFIIVIKFFVWIVAVLVWVIAYLLSILY